LSLAILPYPIRTAIARTGNFGDVWGMALNPSGIEPRES
jgi:hypothetical protein